MNLTLHIKFQIGKTGAIFMRSIGIIVMCLGTFGMVSLINEGDFYSAFCGGGIITLIGLIMVIKGYLKQKHASSGKHNNFGKSDAPRLKVK